MRVFVVEDDETDAECIRRLCPEHTYTVARTYAQALAIMRTDESFDVAIVDIGIGAIDDDALLKLIQKRFVCPVYGVSGYPRHEGVLPKSKETYSEILRQPDPPNALTD